MWQKENDIDNRTEIKLGTICIKLHPGRPRTKKTSVLLSSNHFVFNLIFIVILHGVLLWFSDWEKRWKVSRKLITCSPGWKPRVEVVKPEFKWIYPTTFRISIYRKAIGGYFCQPEYSIIVVGKENCVLRKKLNVPFFGSPESLVLLLYFLLSTGRV